MMGGFNIRVIRTICVFGVWTRPSGSDSSMNSDIDSYRLNSSTNQLFVTNQTGSNANDFLSFTASFVNQCDALNIICFVFTVLY